MRKHSQCSMIILLVVMLMAACGVSPTHSPPSLPSPRTNQTGDMKDLPSQELTETPPWPVATLPSTVDDWHPYEFPELGMRLSLPDGWDVLRMPGFYMVGPASDMSISKATGGIALGLIENVPYEIPELTKTMIQRASIHHASDFYTTTIEVGSVSSVAFWNLPNTCVIIYAPAYRVVHQITFMTPYCSAQTPQLHPLGQKILNSIEFFPPSQ